MSEQETVYVPKILEGSHGTSRTRAKKIRRDGFQLVESNLGRAGRGIYFWVKMHHYLHLAKGWYKFSLSRGRYYSDHESTCIILVVKIEAPEDQILDMEDVFIKDKIAQLAEEQKINEKDKVQRAKLIELFISRLEQISGKIFKVLIIRVAPLAKKFCPEYSILLLGAPLCYVVRDAKIISILRTMNCKEVWHE